jgi:uncharacterized cupin superfamily protein
VANVFEPEFEPDAGKAGFVQRRMRLGREAGASRLGASLYELPAGTAPWPYHFHYGNEELLVVLSGSPSLRTGDGWRELAAGEVVALPRGEKGAHQIANRSSEPARVLIVSEMNSPDVVRYPDSGKTSPREAAPGAGRQRYVAVFKDASATDYFEGEAPPSSGEAPGSG